MTQMSQSWTMFIKNKNSDQHKISQAQRQQQKRNDLHEADLPTPK